MSYSVHPATVEDASAIATIFQTAFADNHIIKYFYRDTPKDIRWNKDVKFFTGQIEQGSIYGRRVTKIVEDSTGKAVAFGVWQYPFHLTPEQQAEKDGKDEEVKKEPPLPGAQVELLDEFFKQIQAGRKKWVNPEKTFFMHILAVLPEHQGKGLGRCLLRPGLDEADKAGAQAYIEASPEGLPLYLKLGWKPVDEMVIDMRPYGGHQVEHMPFLVREPIPVDTVT